MATDGRASDLERLRARSALWRVAAGRPLHRVIAGDGWVRLLLSGEDRLSILLMARPGCAEGLLWHGRLPEPLHAALAPRRDHPLTGLLTGCVLADCRTLAADRVTVLLLSGPQGSPRALLHQDFGPRGNLALVDGNHRLLWALHRPPHTALARYPEIGDLAPIEDTAPKGLSDPVAASCDHIAGHLADDLHRALAGGLTRRLRSILKLVDNLARDLESADRGDEYRRKAEALAAHLHTLEPGQDRLSVPDLRDGSPLDIALDPALSAAANLAQWFKRAGKAEKGREVIAGRLASAEAERDALLALQGELESRTSTADAPLDRLAWLQEFAAAHPDLTPRPQAHRPRGQSPDQPARPFRRYRIEDRWEVWVGRDNRENDELTHRASHLRDLWFHAQGVAGSHVILRTGGRPDQVPRRVIAKAAAIAALHSKARHAGLAPVIWTERRYVRKPRKAAPGLAVCLREKSVMVEPGLGPDVTAV